MRRTLYSALLLLPALFTAGGAAGQRIDSPYRFVETTQSVGLFAGYHVTSPTLTINGAETEIGPRSSPAVGLHYTGRLGGPVSGEVVAMIAPTERTVYGPGSGTDPSLIVPVARGSESMLLGLADLGARLHLTGPRTWRGLAPYVGLSAGLAADLDGSTPSDSLVPESSRYEFGPSLAVGFGAGADYYPSRRLSLRLDARDRLWRLSAPAGLRPTPTEIREWKHNLAISLGAAFHF